MGSKLKVLFIGDGPTAVGESGRVEIFTTGFGQVSKNVIDGLIARGFDVSLLGLNYNGDPHNLPYQIFCPSSHRRDEYGLMRVVELCQKIKPDVVFINNDLWICERFANELSRLGDKQPALVCYMPTDAEGHAPPHVAWMHRCHAHMGQAFKAIPYTFFGKNEWYKAGFGRTSLPIGHGLDPIYKGYMETMADWQVRYDKWAEGERHLDEEPYLEFHKFSWEDIQAEQTDARIEFASGGIGPETFVVMNNDRNSERKRWDILIDAFVRFAAMVKKETGSLFCDGQEEQIARLQEWMNAWDAWNASPIEGREAEPKRPELPDPKVKLWCHTKLHDCWDLTHLFQQAIRREGLSDIDAEILFCSTEINGQDVQHGDVTMEMMRRIYLCVAKKGVYVKTAHGEGWGLSPFEAAACGCYNILPDNTVHSELWGEFAHLVKCPHYGVSGPLSLTWRAPTQDDMASAMFVIWHGRYIKQPEQDAFDYVMSERFDWDRIVDRFASEIEAASAGRKKEG